MENRRKHQRFRAAIAAELELDAEIYEGTTRDVSLTGASVFVRAPLADNAQLNLTLLLTEDGIAAPDADPLCLRAEVVWVGEPTPDGTLAGLRFLEVAEVDKPRLAALLDAISVRPPPQRKR
jgi:c-di-GMP-binding flagellar brake protein YcgR